MAPHQTGLVCFRADLRVVDNTALVEACHRSEQVIAVFISTPMQWHEHNVSPIQVNFIQRRLGVIRAQLAKLGIPLLIEEVADFTKAAQTINQLAIKHHVGHVYCNKQYEWNEHQRDELLGSLLSRQNIKFSVFDDACVISPGRVLTQKGDTFKVFTPFRKEWLKIFRRERPQVQGMPTPFKSTSQISSLFSEQKIELTYPRKDSLQWPVDEEAIRQRLRMFCRDKVACYHLRRDFPAVDGTSCLSPFLAIGALSPRQCVTALLEVYPESTEQLESGAFCWLNEIIWREFYRHLMVAWPQLSREQPFQPWTRYVQWRQSESHLLAWQQGRTGFPIVDAAMRQLKETGWMHNRLRMITASFLTKDLLIHWQEGEQWFMSQLIDGDLAANNGGWQWAASTGTDAQPYFRVFNPTTQGERFDPDGQFIRTWVNELKDVPDKYIHQPHLWSGAVNLNYPQPIVDHKRARIRAIEAFKQAKEYFKHS
ncbi:deoxyribodipyrimidine photo-lyase [uncultured Photobacterium sp.]|uniref:deoxyribodipyrimidine photo-lyase n=1 Tax=uncultured Photobacterium sp. TaxID=173973 RepID=UPI0026368D52|nr:deoxyribodipyrimidine photo-lyase [uncultured Photobacterium sp.]